MRPCRWSGTSGCIVFLRSRMAIPGREGRGWRLVNAHQPTDQSIRSINQVELIGRPINRCDQSMRPTSRSVPTARPINQCNRPIMRAGFRQAATVHSYVRALQTPSRLERHLRASPFTVDVWRRGEHEPTVLCAPAPEGFGFHFFEAAQCSPCVWRRSYTVHV